MNIIGFSPFGYEGSLVTVEVDLKRGIPAVDLVGLADSAVKESRERMRAAIRNSGFEFPPERVLISLSPADVRKEGAGFDLAIALAVLDADNKKRSGIADSADINEGGSSFCLHREILAAGELELSGRIRAVRGINAAVSTAAERGVRCCIVPKENHEEAAGCGMEFVFAASTLFEAFHIMMKIPSVINKLPTALTASPIHTVESVPYEPVSFPQIPESEDFSSVAGQQFLVRGLQIAAAGGHNLLVYGSPGCGKTLALQRFAWLLPNLTQKEAMPVTRIFSLAGLLPAGVQSVRTAPFRMPHQSATLQGIIGGGPQCMPGEISLSHNGVLFLDEAAEYRTSVLQALRVPLETGKAVLSRAGRHTEFPAQFQLLLAANPCPCGNFGSKNKVCVCSAHAIEQYWKKFSSPLLDRIDIRIPVYGDEKAATHTILVKSKSGSCSSTEELRVQIAAAVNIQRKRQNKKNSRLSPEEVHRYCALDSGCSRILEQLSSVHSFSSRAVHSCLKIARTIADMDNAPSIREEDIEEAAALRKSEGSLDICL